MTTRRVQIIAIVLLLPLVFYLGSFVAMVFPKGRFVNRPPYPPYETHYRVDGDWPGVVFWPLEQIHRRVRPDLWNQP